MSGTNFCDGPFTYAYDHVINVGNYPYDDEARGTTTDPLTISGTKTTDESTGGGPQTAVVTWQLTQRPDADHDGIPDADEG